MTLPTVSAPNYGILRHLVIEDELLFQKPRALFIIMFVFAISTLLFTNFTFYFSNDDLVGLVGVNKESAGGNLFFFLTIILLLLGEAGQEVVLPYLFFNGIPF